MAGLGVDAGRQEEMEYETHESLNGSVTEEQRSEFVGPGTVEEVHCDLLKIETKWGSEAILFASLSGGTV